MRFWWSLKHQSRIDRPSRSTSIDPGAFGIASWIRRVAVRTDPERCPLLTRCVARSFRERASSSSRSHAKHWGLKRQQKDSTLVLHRSVEAAANV